MNRQINFKNYKFVLHVINETSKKLRKSTMGETYRTRPLRSGDICPKTYRMESRERTSTGRAEMQQSPESKNTQCVQQTGRCRLKHRNPVVEEERSPTMQDFVAHYKDFRFCSKYNGKRWVNYNQQKCFHRKWFDKYFFKLSLSLGG